VPPIRLATKSSSRVLRFAAQNCSVDDRLHYTCAHSTFAACYYKHRRTEDFTMEGIHMMSQKVGGSSPGIEGLGDFGPQKLEQNVKLEYTIFNVFLYKI